MRHPSCLQTNIRKPVNSELTPKLCGSHGNGLPNDSSTPTPSLSFVPMVKPSQKRSGEVLRSESCSKLTSTSSFVPPSDSEIRKAEDAFAAYMKRLTTGK
jgi:hypothetical protein